MSLLGVLLWKLDGVLMTVQNLAELADRALYSRFLSEFRLRESEIPMSDSLYQDWKRKQGTPETKTSSSPVNRTKEITETLTRLVPDWERRRRMASLRLQTLLRIYLSKWFYQSLEWYEVELVINLCGRFPQLEAEILSPENLSQRRGIDVVLELLRLDESMPLNLKGVYCEGFGNLHQYLLTEENFTAVWKLRSVQSLRDFIFVSFKPGSEHEGKRGIKKPRIRGYRDGKASPRDPTLTALSRQVDQLFWENLHQERWNELWTEMERYSKT